MIYDDINSSDDFITNSSNVNLDRLYGQEIPSSQKPKPRRSNLADPAQQWPKSQTQMNTHLKQLIQEQLRVKEVDQDVVDEKQRLQGTLNDRDQGISALGVTEGRAAQNSGVSASGTHMLEQNHLAQQAVQKQLVQPSSNPSAGTFQLFPQIESIAQFKHHLSMTLSKLRDPLTVPQAKEELHELMTEHIINTDRMNTFLAALSGQSSAISMQGGGSGGSTQQLIASEKNKKKEMIKVYGEAAEIFEESLATFIPKIIQFFIKILKESEVLYHMPVAQSLGKLVQFVVQKIEHEDDRLDQTRQILRAFHQNISVPNQTLQIGCALCIKHMIQNTEPEVLQALLPSTLKLLVDSLKHKQCKSHKNLLECLSALLNSCPSDSLTLETLIPALLGQCKVPVKGQIATLGLQDAGARKEAVRCLGVLAKDQGQQIALYKDSVLEVLQELKCDKSKPVRDATNECLQIYRQIEAPVTVQESGPNEAKAIRKDKELTLGSPDSQIATNFYSRRNEGIYDNFLMNQKPISYRNTDEAINQQSSQKVPDIQVSASANNSPFEKQRQQASSPRSNKYHELFKSQKKDSSPLNMDGQMVEDQQRNNSLEGTVRLTQENGHKIEATDNQQTGQTSPYKYEYSQLEQQIINHQKKVQEQFQQVSGRNGSSKEISEPISSVRTVIQQIQNVEIPGPIQTGIVSNLPPKQKASGNKHSVMTNRKQSLGKVGPFDQVDSKTHKPQLRSMNGSQQKFSHLKIQINEGSSAPSGMASERSRYRSRPSTTRQYNNGSKLSGRGQGYQTRQAVNGGAATSRMSASNRGMHRSSSQNNYLSRNTNDDGSNPSVVTGKLSMATKKKLQMKQQQLTQRPSAIIRSTAPQRNTRVDWNEQAMRNRQSIFSGPKNDNFFSNKSQKETPETEIEIFTARDRGKSGTINQLRELILQNCDSPKKGHQEPNHKKEDQNNNDQFAKFQMDQSPVNGLPELDNQQVQFMSKDTELNKLSCDQLMSQENLERELGLERKRWQKAPISNQIQENQVHQYSDNNQFLSNFGKQFNAGQPNAINSTQNQYIQQNYQTFQEEGQTNQSKFVILRKNNEDNYGNKVVTNDQQKGNFDQLEVQNNLEKMTINELMKHNDENSRANAHSKAVIDSSKQERNSKIVCDDEYQNFTGSNLATQGQNARKMTTEFTSEQQHYYLRAYPCSSAEQNDRMQKYTTSGGQNAGVLGELSSDNQTNLGDPGSRFTPSTTNPRMQNNKDVIVLKQLRKGGVKGNAYGLPEDQLQSRGAGQYNHYGATATTNQVNNESYQLAHARIGSGDHKIIGGADNSFSLNSDMGLIHNLTQQEWSNNENKQSNAQSPDVKFAKLRQAQLDFNNLQKQRMAAIASTSMTQTNNSIKNQVVDDFSISCYRQSQCTVGGAPPQGQIDEVGSNALLLKQGGSSVLGGGKATNHQLIIDDMIASSTSPQRILDSKNPVMERNELSEDKNHNLPTTMESGDKADQDGSKEQEKEQDFDGDKLRILNDNIGAVSEQQTHSASQGCSNQPTPRYPDPSGGKAFTPRNLQLQSAFVTKNFELQGQVINMQGMTSSSRDIGSTIHDIDLKMDSHLIIQILQEVQMLRDENRQLKEHILRIEQTNQKKQSENEVRIKALETLFLENKVPTHLQSLEQVDDQHESSFKLKNDRTSYRYGAALNASKQYGNSRSSNLSFHQMSQRRSTMNEENLNSLNRSKVDDYMAEGIDLANKKPQMTKHSQQQSMPNLRTSSQYPMSQSGLSQQMPAAETSMISTRRAQEKIADANQVVELALNSHNVSFLYQLMDNQSKFQEVNPENIEKLLQFTFQKLTLQKGRHRLSSARRDNENSVSRATPDPNASSSRRDASATGRSSVRSRSRSFVVDHGLVDSLLMLTVRIIDIHMPLGSIDMNSTVFLDLIQLFIDLLKDDSILTSLQKIKLQQIYEKIEKQF